MIDEEQRVLAEAAIRPYQEKGQFYIERDIQLSPFQRISIVGYEGQQMITYASANLFVDTPGHSCLAQVNCEQKLIAITFDSANGYGKIDRLLELLETYDAHCTFFLLGKFVEKFPETVADIDNRGHELANHSTNHVDMREQENDSIYYQIKKTNDMIEEITGKPVLLYRPPSGYHSYRDRAISRGLGSEPIFWTFDSHDGFSDASYAHVARRMDTLTVNGSIILMHIYGQYTLDVLEQYIPRMQAEGYRFVTVSQLLSSGQIVDQLGNVYDPIPIREQ